MNYTEIMRVGTPVVVRSYTSGVIVGRLQAGSGGTVSLTDWRWLRRWEGVGGEGSVYDLIKSSVVPSRRSDLFAATTIVQQADVIAIEESDYQRLAG